jgi:hypothetical protein
MASFPALDVAVGLSFMYFLLSVLATTATETVSRFLKQRARMLESWLGDVLSNSESGDQAIVDHFFQTPAMRMLQISTGSQTKQARISAKLKLRGSRAPSYIPSTHFVAAVLETGRKARDAATTAQAAYAAIGTDLERLQGTPAGDALLGIYDAAGGDAERFRHNAEGWFDDQMERLSGVYKRWSQWFVWAISLLVVLALNANTLRIAETLWNDPAARATLVAQSSSSPQAVSASAAVTQVDKFPLPLGWSHAGYSGWSWVFASFGALLTLGAISLGAPFWFDALSRLARIRQTGTPPVAACATRQGEGDQKRTTCD